MGACLSKSHQTNPYKIQVPQQKIDKNDPLYINLQTNKNTNVSTNQPNPPQPLSKPIQNANHQEQQQQSYIINNDNLDIKIQEASVQQNQKKAKHYFSQIKIFLSNLKDKSFIHMEKQAFVSASLAQLCQNDGQIHQQAAYLFYKQFQTNYYEQLIILLNNSALRNERINQFDKAIQKYLQIIEIQTKYYCINDQRKLISQNNLACAQCQNKNLQDGMRIFQQLMKGIQHCQTSKEIVSLILQNHKYYKNKNS